MAIPERGIDRLIEIERGRERLRDREQTHRHKRHVHEDIMKLTTGLDLGLKSCPLPGESCNTELPLMLNSTLILSAIILWHGSLAQPCPKHCTEVSGTCSNKNTQ